MILDYLLIKLLKILIRRAKNTPTIKVATPYFKPEKNKTERKPDYYLHKTDKWLVFPHELEGLTRQEMLDFKPELSEILEKIKL